jgi:hypothetical protein
VVKHLLHQIQKKNMIHLAVKIKKMFIRVERKIRNKNEICHHQWQFGGQNVGRK